MTLYMTKQQPLRASQSLALLIYGCGCIAKNFIKDFIHFLLEPRHFLPPRPHHRVISPDGTCGSKDITAILLIDLQEALHVLHEPSPLLPPLAQVPDVRVRVFASFGHAPLSLDPGSLNRLQHTFSRHSPSPSFMSLNSPASSRLH